MILSEEHIFTYRRCPRMYNYIYTNKYPPKYVTPHSAVNKLMTFMINNPESNRDLLMNEADLVFTDWQFNVNRRFDDKFITSFRLNLFRIARFIYSLSKIATVDFNKPYALSINKDQIVGKSTFKLTNDGYVLYNIARDFQKVNMENAISISRTLFHTEIVDRMALQAIAIKQRFGSESIAYLLYDSVNDDLVQITNSAFEERVIEDISQIITILRKTNLPKYKTFTSSCMHDCAYVSLCLNEY